MKRLAIQVQLVLFRRCYCASSNGEQRMDSLDDLRGLSLAVPSRSWAERIAARRQKRTGQEWLVTKWVAH